MVKVLRVCEARFWCFWVGEGKVARCIDGRGFGIEGEGGANLVETEEAFRRGDVHGLG